MKFGAHISAKKPIWEAPLRAHEIGCSCMQIFANDPQRWAAKKISDADLEKLKQEAQKFKIDPIIIHSIYLVNFASQDQTIYEKTIEILIDDMQKAAKMGALGVNTHLGSTKDKTLNELLSKICSGIKTVLENSSSDTNFIIENSAGSGSVIGDTLEEIAQIIAVVGSNRVKVIIDTAHAFGSGYDLREKNVVDAFIEHFDQLIGLDRLLGFHFNDSLVELNSKKDRHADIDKGYLGIDAFRFLINNNSLKDKIAILETPQNIVSWPEQLKLLRSLQEKI